MNCTTETPGSSVKFDQKKVTHYILFKSWDYMIYVSYLLWIEWENVIITTFKNLYVDSLVEEWLRLEGI